MKQTIPYQMTYATKKTIHTFLKLPLQREMLSPRHMGIEGS